jgi:hypothetical protein
MDDVWSAFGGFDDSDRGPGNRPWEIGNWKSDPDFRTRSALFARLDERAGAMTEDSTPLNHEDDSSDEAEDGLDLWGMLF